MQPKDLVDINSDYQTRRQRLKRRFVRVIIPVGGVFLIVAAIMIISTRANDPGMRER